MKIIKQALNPTFLKLKLHREEIEFFKKELGALLNRINPKESEEYHKNLIKDFLNAVYYKDKHYIQDEIPFTHFDIRDYHEIVRRADNENDRQLIALYKFLLSVNLLKRSVANDNNQLNKDIYAELLHIIGLEEVTQGNLKLIVRKTESDRDSGSLIENTIERIDAKNKWDNFSVATGIDETHGLQIRVDENLQFDVALDLAITWINRILFLKLLESQILKYHNRNRDFAFLSRGC